jgi:hypothetical protein
LHKLAGDKIHIRIVVRNATQAKPEWKKWGCEVSSSSRDNVVTYFDARL